MVAVITVDESVNEGVESKPSGAVVVPKNLLLAMVPEVGKANDANDQFPILLLKAAAF